MLMGLFEGGHRWGHESNEGLRFGVRWFGFKFRLRQLLASCLRMSQVTSLSFGFLTWKMKVIITVASTGCRRS